MKTHGTYSSDGVKFGWKVAHLPEAEREAFKLELLARIAELSRIQIERLRMKLQASGQKESEYQQALRDFGQINESANRMSLWIAAFELIVLVFCSLGEFHFACWVLMPFDIGGPVVTYMIALASLLLFLETMDRFLKALRIALPTSAIGICLTITCLGFVMMFLFLFLGGDIRAGLYEITNALTSVHSLEDQISLSQGFGADNNAKFMFMMIALGVSFALISGMNYHDVKHRIPSCLNIRRLYKNIRKERAKMEGYASEVSDLETQESSFSADFELGVLEGQAANNTASSNGFTSRAGGGFRGVNTPSWEKTRSLLTSFLPLLLILGALFLYLLISGKAHADQHIVLLDISRSVEVQGYQGVSTEYEKNFNGVIDYVTNHLNPTDRILIIAITGESFSRPFVLAEAQLPKKKGYFGEIIGKEKLRLIKVLKGLNLKPSAESTDIIGAVNLTGIYFAAVSERKRLVIFSDMRQCGQGLNFEKPSLIRVDYLMNRMKELHLIPSLEGVDVWCLGVHTAGKDAAYWKSLRDFWSRFSEKAAQNLKPIQ